MNYYIVVPIIVVFFCIFINELFSISLIIHPPLFLYLSDRQNIFLLWLHRFIYVNFLKALFLVSKKKLLDLLNKQTFAVELKPRLQLSLCVLCYFIRRVDFLDLKHKMRNTGDSNLTVSSKTVNPETGIFRCGVVKSSIQFHLVWFHVFGFLFLCECNFLIRLTQWEYLKKYISSSK